VDTAARILDFGQPVAVMLMTILQHIDDEDEPGKIVAALVEGMPRGSYLALSHPANDIEPEAMAKMADRLNRVLAEPITLRGRDEVAGFFEGLELVEPGLVRCSDWWPDGPRIKPLDPVQHCIVGAVGRKP